MTASEIIVKAEGHQENGGNLMLVSEEDYKEIVDLWLEYLNALGLKGYKIRPCSFLSKGKVELY